MSAEASVNLDAIRTSVAACRAAAPTAELLAVVKADAYGHGLIPCSRAALDGGATWLGTAHLGEALELRAAGVSAPVLSWLNPPGAPFAAALAAGIDLAASSVRAVEEIVAAARDVGRPARLHLKVDTGLARGGAPAVAWPDVVRAAGRAVADGTAVVIGVMTHFVHADAPESATTTEQVALFRDALEVAAALGVRPEVRHLANSAATLTRPDTHFDLVRPGLACYGLSPVPEVRTARQLGLTPAMTLRAPLALCKPVAAGQGVSYGHTWHAPRATTLGLVPLGYADGIPRAASNRGEVWWAGRRRPIAGRVCMDQFVIDLGGEPGQDGQEVVIFGPGDGGEPTAQDWAEAAGTISYEIVTRIGPRVPRVYPAAP